MPVMFSRYDYYDQCTVQINGAQCTHTFLQLLISTTQQSVNCRRHTYMSITFNGVLKVITNIYIKLVQAGFLAAVNSPDDRLSHYHCLWSRLQQNCRRHVGSHGRLVTSRFPVTSRRHVIGADGRGRRVAPLAGCRRSTAVGRRLIVRRSQTFAASTTT